MTHNAHDSLTTRRRKQVAQLERIGADVTQPADMLELYLLGESAVDIAAAYKVTAGTVYRCICKEALYQLMEQRNLERLEEMDELL